MYFVGNSDDDKAAEATKVCSNTDTQRNFDQNLLDTVTKCKPLIERLVKYEFNGLMEC